MSVLLRPSTVTVTSNSDRAVLNGRDTASAARAEVAGARARASIRVFIGVGFGFNASSGPRAYCPYNFKSLPHAYRELLTVLTPWFLHTCSPGAQSIPRT